MSADAASLDAEVRRRHAAGQGPTLIAIALGVPREAVCRVLDAPAPPPPTAVTWVLPDGGTARSQYTHAEIVAALRSLAGTLGHAPTVADWRVRELRPAAGTIERFYGTWTAALRAADLAPVSAVRAAVVHRSAPADEPAMARARLASTAARLGVLGREDEAADQPPAPRRFRAVDGLPIAYVDEDGCSLHDHCLTCPLSECRYNRKPGEARAELAALRLRDHLDAGLSVEAAAAAIGVSRRTAYRLRARRDRPGGSFGGMRTPGALEPPDCPTCGGVCRGEIGLDGARWQCGGCGWASVAPRRRTGPGVRA